MASIEKRGKASWRVGFQIPTLAGWVWLRKTIHVDPALSEKQQRKQAEKVLREMEREYDEEGQLPLEYTVRTWSEVWMEKHVKPNCSPVTYSNYRELLDTRILPLIGDVPLSQLTPMKITDWLAEVRDSPRRTTRKEETDLARKRSPSWEPKYADQQGKPLSPKTVLHYYTCLESMLSVAVRLEIIGRNPMEKVTRPRVRKKKVNFLTEERAVDLLRCLADEPNMSYRAAVLLALLCGLRLGEICALKLSDVDWEKGTIDISRALKYTPGSGAYESEPKTEAGERLITLPAGMMTVLHETREYQEECKRLAPAVWCGEGWIVHGWDGRQLHHDTPSAWFRKFADAHGFQGVRFHDLRHTHATILLANNIDVVSVARRLGHEDPSVTLRIYAHALARRDVEAAQTMERLFGDIRMPPPPDLRVEK